MPVEFCVESLDRHLRSHVDDLRGEVSLERVNGGRSNPTFFVNYANRRLVLRKQPAGPLLPSAHAIDREFRILSALRNTDVPVPRALFFESDSSVIGTPFYVMERIEGRVFDDPALPSVSPSGRREMVLASADVLARMHRLNWESLGLADFGRPGNFYARQISRWSRQWTQSRTRDLPDIDALAAWLTANIPASDAAAIVHGDFRLNNLIFHPSEPRIVAVLDWELCTIGHPLADVAYLALMWRLKPSEHLGVLGLDLPALGIPSEQQWLHRYRSAMPFGELPTPFHTAFSLFRLAVIAEGVGDRARQGMASGDDAEHFGQLSAVFARRAIESLQRA